MADETLAPTQDDQELLSAEFGGAFAHMLQTGSWQGHIENVPIAKALRAIASARLQGREEAARVADIRVKRAQFAVDSHGAGPHAEAFAAELVVAQSIAASIRALSPSRVVDDVEAIAVFERWIITLLPRAGDPEAAALIDDLRAFVKALSIQGGGS